MPKMEPLGIHEVDAEVRHQALSVFRTSLVREGTLDPVLRELVRLKIAALNACQY